MRKVLPFGLLVLAGFAPTPSHAGARTAAEIIAASDAVRNPGKPFSVRSTITEYRNGKERESVVVVVYVKEEKASGQYRSLARFLSPPRDENKLLLRSGDALWFYDPSSQSSVRVSPQQRVMGQASNGDLLAVNFSRDYQSVLEGEEAIADVDQKPRQSYKLTLKARNDAAPYPKAEYWVEVDSFLPVKARFYADSGRLLKTAYYGSFREQLGRMRPTEVVIFDGVDAKVITRVSFSDFRYREIPEEWLQREYLPRFQGD